MCMRCSNYAKYIYFVNTNTALTWLYIWSGLNNSVIVCPFSSFLGETNSLERNLAGFPNKDFWFTVKLLYTQFVMKLDFFE